MLNEIKKALRDMYGAPTDERLIQAYKYIESNSVKWIVWSVDEKERLQAENERLRKALEFYTDSKKYLVSEKYSGGEFMGAWAEICGDSGMVARQELKEVNHDRTTDA